jgi:dinuclear metal center YbgI/SA1388 family protein
MTAGELIKYFEDWAPPGISWERDNTGLQIGSRELKIKNILLCLELNQKVLTEAVEKRCNFVFTHHPLIFTPIRKLDFQNNPQAKLIESIIKNNITIYSAHTNLDYTKDGVSFELAKTLKLKKIKFLKLQEGNQFKVVVFVPKDHLEKLAREVFSAGGGIIGEYNNCSFRVNGEGTFLGSENSNPAIGQKQNFEKVEETRLEFLVDSWKLNKVISALIKVHPYEEPAYDVIPLKNKNVNYGAGAIGELDKKFTEKEFLEYAGNILKTGALRYSSGKKKTIRKVAVCGGAGSEYIGEAIAAGADAFITADIKYHSFHDALDKILLIDAGHYETEIFSLNAVKTKIEKRIDVKEKIKVFKYSGSTNPVQFYKH